MTSNRYINQVLVIVIINSNKLRIIIHQFSNKLRIVIKSRNLLERHLLKINKHKLLHILVIKNSHTKHKDLHKYKHLNILDQMRNKLKEHRLHSNLIVQIKLKCYTKINLFNIVVRRHLHRNNLIIMLNILTLVVFRIKDI
jgi:hypothetical protein